jgi:hypothetical protein
MQFVDDNRPIDLTRRNGIDPDLLREAVNQQAPRIATFEERTEDQGNTLASIKTVHESMIASRDQFRIWILNSIHMNLRPDMPSLWEFCNNLLLTQNNEYSNLLNVVTKLSEIGYKKSMQLRGTYSIT